MNIGTFISQGGLCILNTGATKERSERTFMNPVFCLLDEELGFEKASEVFKQKIYLLPENGSSILKPKEVSVVENELWFGWDEYYPLHVPDKERLRRLLETTLVPVFPGSFVIGDKPGEIGRRNYILSLKGLKEVPNLIEKIRQEVIPHHPEIDWTGVDMKAARTTIDFINAKSGKEPATRKLLQMTGFDGPIIGFGDLGDEFAKVPEVLTFNVNEKDPNSFRARNVASLEAYRWIEIPKVESSMNSKKEMFFRGEKIEVVRNSLGEVVSLGENILAALPLTRGAGEATAEILEKLMGVGYFSKK